MAKSIESIWKDGFLNESQLIAPKINDLYSRKSQNTVDKLHKMFAININAIIICSLIMLILMSLIGAPYLGLYICCLLTPLVFIAKKELHKSINLSKGQSSYDYLINFDKWLKEAISTYATYYRFFYPLFFIGMAVQGIVTKAGGKIIALLLEKFPTELFFLGQPYYIVVAITLLTMIVALSSNALYRFDLNLVYGRQFKKLDELIADMEELRK